MANMRMTQWLMSLERKSFAFSQYKHLPRSVLTHIQT
jgi:hypothetical protein